MGWQQALLCALSLLLVLATSLAPVLAEANEDDYLWAFDEV